MKQDADANTETRRREKGVTLSPDPCIQVFSCTPTFPGPSASRKPGLRKQFTSSDLRITPFHPISEPLNGDLKLPTQKANS